MQCGLRVFQRHNTVLDAAREGGVVGASRVDVGAPRQTHGRGVLSVLGVVVGAVNVAASIGI